MKIKHIFTTFGLAIAAIGIGAGFAGKGQVKEAKATGSGTYVYLTPGTNWKTDKPRYAAYFYGTGDAWSETTTRVVDIDNEVYKIEIPTGTWSNVIFCRMNPSTSVNNWDNRYDQTNDLDLNVGKLYTVADDAWNKGNGSWGDSAYTEPTQSATIVGINGASNENAMVFNSTDGGEFKLENVTIYKDDEIYINLTKGAVTTPYGYSALEEGEGSLKTEGAVSQGELVSDSVYRIKFKSEGSYSLYMKSNGKIWSQLDSDSIAEAYADRFLDEFTCGGKTGPYAGTVTAPAGKWDELSEAWDGLVVGAQGKFTTATPNEEGNKYEQVMARYKYVIEKYGTSVYEDFMGKGYEKASSNFMTSVNNTNNSSLLIVAVSALTLTALGGYFLLKKKKEN